MAAKTRKRKQSNFNLSDERIQQPPSLVHNNMVHNQVSNSTQQNTCGDNEQRGIADKTRKRKQNSFSLPYELIQQSLNTPTRTRVGRRVYSGVDDQQVSNQLIHHHHGHDHANLALNETIGLIHSHTMDNQARNSQHEESTQQNTCDIRNESNEVENGQSNNEKKEKKTRGPTYMLEIWGRPSTLPHIKLEFDSFGRPIGANRGKFCEFLGTIARNGKCCPLDVEDWHKMPNECKKEMLNIVKSRYDITLADEDWILKSISKKWRNWKHYLKTKYFLPNREMEVLIDEKDERVLEDQWANILTYWNKEEVKARSEKNKAARSNKNMDHSTGKRSFAQVYDKLAKEKGRPPSRADMFKVCYIPGNGSSSIVSNYLDAIEERRNQLPEGSEDPVGRDDIFSQVTGQDRPGRVRMFGEGVSPSDVWGEVPNRNNCKRIMLEQRSELLEMKNQIAELQSQLLTQQRFTSQESQGLTLLCNNLSRPALTKQPLRVGGLVALKSLFDPTKIVAKGCIHSTDPNSEVGRQVLGENWCQIHVKVVLQPEEQLIRPYDYYQTLGDALGEMVAWPCHLVIPSECR